MTATALITELSKTTLVGLKVEDLTVAQNVTNLLSYLNEAKDEIAKDTKLWLGGETVTMVTDTYEYTLATLPVAIIDVFDANNTLRQRNDQGFFGYYQTAPDKIQFNNITNGLVVKVNYHYTPVDYIGANEVVIPRTLINAIKKYVSHKAYEVLKDDSSIAKSAQYKNDYNMLIKSFIDISDVSGADSVVNLDNKIWLRGIR
jgi:hypothetical protein